MHSLNGLRLALSVSLLPAAGWSSQQREIPQTKVEEATVSRDIALIILSTSDMATLLSIEDLVEGADGEVSFEFPPNAFEAFLNPDVEAILKQNQAVLRIERGVVDTTGLAELGGQALTAASIWNALIEKSKEVLPPDTSKGRHKMPPGGDAIDGRDPEYLPARPQRYLKKPISGFEPQSPGDDQLSAFMAGRIVYSVVFVESDSVVPCSSIEDRRGIELSGVAACPVDSSSEDWSSTRKMDVLAEIKQGLDFWKSRVDRPKVLKFVEDNQGERRTCVY